MLTKKERRKMIAKNIEKIVFLKKERMKEKYLCKEQLN